MAKPKNAPALFEVIRSAQEKQRKEQEREKQLKLQRELAAVNGEGGGEDNLASSLLRSPLFWFKGKQALAEHAARQQPSAAGATLMREIPPSPAPIAPPVRVARPAVDIAEEARKIRAEIAASRPAPEPEYEPTPEPEAPVVPVAPAPLFVQPAAPEAAQASVVHESYDDVPRSFFDARPVEATDDAPRHVTRRDDLGGDDFDVDAALADAPAEDTSSRRAFMLPLNYTTGIVAGCGVLLLCGAIYLGATLRNGPQIAMADAQTRPDVLNVTPPQANVASKPPAPARVTPAVTPVDPAMARASRTGAESTSVENVKPIAPPTSVKRVYGTQYIVVLSSPIAKDAHDAVKFLADNGIPATAEQALPGYSRSWYSVITAKGFEKTRNSPEFDQYVGQLSKLMAKYAKGSKFKSFQPDVYTWRAK